MVWVVLVLALVSVTAVDGLQCQSYRLGVEANVEALCDGCFWLQAQEQDGTDTGRCYQCSQQTTQDGCEGTGVCFWLDGRDELGGSDCTLCAGRTEDDCKATGYCFWDLEGFEGVCSKCPGHTDAESCEQAGCFWRKVQGVEKCVKCGGFHLQENCEAAGCKWNSELEACRGNSDIFLLPPPPPTENATGTTTTITSTSSSSTIDSAFPFTVSLISVLMGGLMSFFWYKL